MKKLPLDALRFEATSKSTKNPDGTERRSLRLHYSVHVDGKTIHLVTINLTDATVYPDPGRDNHSASRDRFWFRYHPLRLKKAPPDKSLRHFPQIDLIVYSSVRVFVQRHKEAMDKYEKVGFEDLPAEATVSGHPFSPVRPKIRMRRVHRMPQVPMRGAPSLLPLQLSPFSFYAEQGGALHTTVKPTLADLLRAEAQGTEKRASEEQADPFEEALRNFVPNRTWTRVFFDERYTEFVWPQSSYRLQVHDQHFDAIDGDPVRTDEEAVEKGGVKVSEALSKQDEATQLISYPKYLYFDFGLDSNVYFRADAQGRTFQSQYRTRLLLTKSSRVLLVGSTIRSDYHDARTARLLARLGHRGRGPNYRDSFPDVAVRRIGGEILSVPNLEKHAPKLQYEHSKSTDRKLREFQFAVGVGFTPVLGEIFDLYELYTALHHGEDAFGNKLSDTEKLITAVAVILPGLGAPFLREVGLPMLAEARTALAESVAVLQRALAP